MLFKRLLVFTLAGVVVYGFSPNEYFPDENTTEAFEFNITDPGESNSSFVVTYDNNGSIEFYEVPTENNLEREDSETGRIEYNREHNLSNPSDLDKWLKSQINTFPLRANQISQKVQEKGGFGDTSEKGVAAMATDYIYEHSDQNSTRRKVIDSVDAVYKNLYGKIASQKHIQCYLSRSLKPGYLCPLPTLENSFIMGYAQKDEKKISLEECNEKCKIQKSCVEQNMPFAKFELDEPNQNLVTEPYYIINANPKQIVKTVELKLSIADLDEDKLKKQAYKLRYSVSYFRKEHWYDLFENYKVTLKDGEVTLTFYLNKSAEQIKIKFHRPYEVDPYVLSYEIVLDPNEHAYTLESTKVNYTDDKHYFCPVKQYILPDEDPNIACKDGRVEDVYTSGSIMQICIPNNLPDYRDGDTGAYKSKAVCETECVEQDTCIPTYRRPAVLDYDGYIPSDMYDIEVGCIDDPSNQACTQEACEQFFRDHDQPIGEKVWTNNDDVVVTVKDSTRVAGVERPKIDIDAELSSNGLDKTKVFKEEMKDGAYNAMIERGTYNVSSKRINEVYPFQNGYEYKESEQTKRQSVTWLIKGRSDQYDDGKTYSFYPVMYVDVIYHPIKAINIYQQTYYASEDPKTRAVDRYYLVRDGDSWKMFRRQEYIKMYVKDSVDDIYKWFDTAGASPVKDVTFQNGQFVAYGNTLPIAPMVSKQLDSGTPYERFNISLDMNMMISQLQGVLFVAQTNVGNTVTKIFSINPQDVDLATKAEIYSYGLYGLYYEDSEANIGKIKNDFTPNQFFDYLNRKAYPEGIKSETLYTDEKVKMYMHGTPENMSVNSVFTPSSAEEGKKTFFFNFLYDE